MTTNENPAFGIYQFVLDLPQAILATDAYSSFTTGMPEILSQFTRYNVNRKLFNELFADARQHGAFTSFTKEEGDPLGLKEARRGLLAKILPSKIKDKVLDNISRFNSSTEYLTRVAVYEKMRGKLIDKFKKDNNRDPQAKELTDIKTIAAAETRSVFVS